MPQQVLTSKVAASHLDALGSVQAITGSSQAVETTYRTDAWGNVIAGSAQENPAVYLGGLGYWNEPTLELDYVRARWLNPATGSWLSVDPVTSEPRYRYAANGPTFRVDPSGTQYGTNYGVNTSVGSNSFYNRPPLSAREKQIVEQSLKENQRYGVPAQLFGGVSALWDSNLSALLHLPEPWYRSLVEKESDWLASAENALGIAPLMHGLDGLFKALLPGGGPFAKIAPSELVETPFSPRWPAFVGGCIYVDV